MKTVHLMKNMNAIVLSVMLFAGFSLSASAAPIDANSELAFFGTYAPTGGADLASATGLAFPTPVFIAAGASDFAFAQATSATFSGFDFNPATPGSILTFAGGGAFTATNIFIDLQDPQSLDLTMAGVWSLNGFDDTMGGLVLTADALGGLYTFSAAGTVSSLSAPGAVPLPGGMLLFASALAALGLLRRRAA